MVNGQHPYWGQGSVLGPVVSNCISDREKVTEPTLIKPADDTKVGGPADTLKGMATIQSNMDRLEWWATGT